MSPLGRRLGAVLFTVFVLGAVQWIPLPGLNTELLDQAQARFTLDWLGVGPWLSAFVLVEVAARVVPAWQALRFEGRDRLFRAVVVVWLLASVLQALSLSISLEQIYVGMTPLVYGPGWSFRLTTTATLVAGSALVGGICFWNHHNGLGTGLVLAWAATQAFAPLLWWQSVQLGEIVLLLPALVVASGIAIATLRTPGGLRPAPAGLVPLLWVPGLVSTWAAFNPGFAPHSTQATLLGIAGVTVLLSMLEHPTLFARQRQDFSLAIVVNAAWGCGLAWLVLERGAPSWGIGLILLPTVLLDLASELSARRNGLDHEVARFHHVQTADAAIAELEHAGIDAALRGDRTRALLHFFGPYLPIGILVAPDDQGRATEVLEQL